ncbi:MAG: hypothetical protein KGJ13_02200 [Patescibacteria group bacterium]|nr:hypothetical protein [Patescibacteria group bacterium]
MKSTHIYGWIISIIATSLVTLWASQLAHVRDEVSQQEVAQLVDAKTASLTEKVDNLTRTVQSIDSHDSVIVEQLKHFRVKATWYSVQ